MNKYDKLDKSGAEDIDTVRQYAEARTEVKLLEVRIEYLEELISDNDELSSAVWTTAEGKCIPIADLEDDHLKNIVSHLGARGAFNRRIVAEYRKRFNDTPLLSGGFSSDSDDDEDNGF